jgi:hypothetical protein
MHGISKGHMKYQLQILSYTWDVALRNLLIVNKEQALKYEYELKLSGKKLIL